MGFERRPLEEIVEDILDRRGVTPTKLGGEFVSSGHRVISAKLIKGGRIVLDADEPRFVNSEMYARWMKTPLRCGDVIMTSEAPLGELAYLDEPVDWVLGQRLFAIRPRKDVVGGRFLYYALASPGVRDAIFSRASGSTVQGIRQAELRKVEVPVPPMSVQFEVESLLGALDERIDSLRKSSSACEAIAQALFKSWFVDFDPVRAKAEGREPEGMDATTAALFPAEFDSDNALPCGWAWVKLGDVFDVGIGKTPPRKEAQWFSQSVEDVPWVSIRDMGEAGVFLMNTAEKLTTEAVTRFNVRCVPAGTVMMSFKLTVGRVAISDGVLTTNEAIAHFKSMPESLPQSYLYCYLKSYDMNSIASTSSIATATNSKAIRGLAITHPGDPLALAFNDAVAPLFERIRMQQKQANTLSEIRDTILPRLISGKLRLPDVEREVEAVTA